jgi:hypothetical protein
MLHTYFKRVHVPKLSTLCHFLQSSNSHTVRSVTAICLHGSNYVIFMTYVRVIYTKHVTNDLRSLQQSDTARSVPSLQANKWHPNPLSPSGKKKDSQRKRFALHGNFLRRRILHSLSHTSHKLCLNRRHFVSEAKEKSLDSFSLARKIK